VIALDTSAIVAIAMEEDEAEAFNRAIAWREAVVGTPTLFEARIVLTDKMPGFADAFLDTFVNPDDVRPIAFSMDMYRLAADAFDRFGKGRGHPAKLNFGDCMAYAVAKFHDVPLLYKGDDFSKTDIRPALP
jgi:ribonuclease VapC